MDEFRNVGFGGWLGREGDFGLDSDEIEGKEAPATALPNLKRTCPGNPDGRDISRKEGGF